jgi:glycosyltransferase involved in cell wall biosynthesis
VSNSEQTSIVIPALDEGASIGRVVAEFREAARWHEILVVDDGSRGDTGQRAADAGARIVRHPHNAFVTGTGYALEQISSLRFEGREP